jgi:hypothetical protein
MIFLSLSGHALIYLTNTCTPVNEICMHVYNYVNNLSLTHFQENCPQSMIHMNTPYNQMGRQQFKFDSCTSIYMSTLETQLTDGKYSSICNIPNCVRVNQCYGLKVNIQRSILTNFWPYASFTSRKFWLKITTLSDEMRHFYF